MSYRIALLSLFAFAPALRGADPALVSCAWVRAENDGAGAGFVVDEQKRWLVTCRHVVGDRDKVDVFFPWVRGGELVTDKNDYLGNRPSLRELGLLVTGKVVMKMDAADLALIELDSLPFGVKAIPFATRPAQVGDPLRVVGHRTDLDTLWNLSTGPLRTRGSLVDGYPWRGGKLAVNADVLIGQLPIEEGDSGGPVLNERGELVGMVCALRRRVPLAAVAISTEEIRRFLDIEKSNATSEPIAIAETLTRATVWIRPTATEFHLAGVLIEPNLILTAARGLGSSDRVGVAFPIFANKKWIGERGPYRDPVGLHLRGNWRAGEVVARDTSRDLALIRVESVPESARPVPLSRERLNLGDAVHAMNHPGGLEFAWVYSLGAVRQRGRVKLADGDGVHAVPVNLFQLPTQAGSPGGPVLNDRGELFGVLSAREGTQFVGYAASGDEVQLFLTSARLTIPLPSVASAHAGLERASLYARADRAIEAKEWQAARGDLERILDPYPADAAARQLLVFVLLGLGKDDDAAAAVADAVRVDPKRMPLVARDLLAQADALAKKFPDSPSAAADWLTKALTAMKKVSSDPATPAALETTLKQSAVAKTDKERLAILRAFVAKWADDK